MNIKIVLLITLLMGGVLIGKQVNDYDVSKRNDLIEHVKMIRSAIDIDQVSSLYGDDRDYINPSYIRLKEQLTDLSDVVVGSRYIYIMMKKDNQILLMVDTQPRKYGLEGLAVPGEKYEEMDVDVEEILSAKGEKVTNPYTDKWGTFISGLASITKKDDNKVVALVGVDFEAKEWQEGMWMSLWSRFVIVGLILIIEVTAYKGLTKNKKNLMRLSYLATVLDSSQDAIYSIDINRKILSWNLGAEKLYGYTESEALGKEVIKLVVPENEIINTNKNFDLVFKGKILNGLIVLRKNKYGKIITVTMNFSPIFNSSNIVDSISVIARDISLQKIKDDELKKYNLELEKTNQLMIGREIKMIELKKKLKEYEIKNK